MNTHFYRLRAYGDCAKLGGMVSSFIGGRRRTTVSLEVSQIKTDF